MYKRYGESPSHPHEMFLQKRLMSTAPTVRVSKKPIHVPQLHYLHLVYGLAFSIRATLHHGKIPFEDIRHTHTEFKTLKEKPGMVPLGKLPILILPKDQVVCQSNTILRWAGKQSGLYPADHDRAAIVDEMLESVQELADAIPHHKDNEERTRLREQFLDHEFDTYMRYFTWRLEPENGKFLLGNDFSIADLKLARQIAYFNSGLLGNINADQVRKFPTVCEHYEATCAHPIYKAQIDRENAYAEARLKKARGE